jgi:hypothetical protein
VRYLLAAALGLAAVAAAACTYTTEITQVIVEWPDAGAVTSSSSTSSTGGGGGDAGSEAGCQPEECQAIDPVTCTSLGVLSGVACDGGVCDGGVCARFSCVTAGSCVLTDDMADAGWSYRNCNSYSVDPGSPFCILVGKPDLDPDHAPWCCPPGAGQ